ncbi:hypothetical protein DV515_00017678 [Chloebia gouldiae]|uniref:Uncharacterized protein n=1 Tax=Chloebia gouldiae TaxID=44316 RepID=A0A3L8Q9V6_CHLGU|nr:hypothetical protein DV515_00017678 [Chloebia gouldiae]
MLEIQQAKQNSQKSQGCAAALVRAVGLHTPHIPTYPKNSVIPGKPSRAKLCQHIQAERKSSGSRGRTEEQAV